MAKGSLRVNGIIVDTDGEIKASTGDSIVIREDDGSAVITVDTAGKVGINTTAPGAQFDIRGPAGTGTAPAGVLRLSTAETTVVDADQLGRIEFIAPLEASGTDAILGGASIYAVADDTFAADNNATELVFATGASEAPTEQLRIASDGKVGINAATPASLLDVRGTVQVGVDDTGFDVQFFGDTANHSWLWDTSANGVVQKGTLTVGQNDIGHDVKFFGATSGKYWLWDEDQDTMMLVGSSNMTGSCALDGSLSVGGNTNGHDVQFFGDTAGKSWLWDESADKMIITGDTQLTGTLTVGVDDTGHDVKFFGATAGNYLSWDESANTLQLVGTQAIFDKVGADANPLYFDLRKSRHATAMGGTALSDNDVIGHIRFMGDDGNSAEEFASIKCLVNGTVGNADSPGELQFWTTPDGSATPAQRMAKSASEQLLQVKNFKFTQGRSV